MAYFYGIIPKPKSLGLGMKIKQQFYIKLG